MKPMETRAYPSVTTRRILAFEPWDRGSHAATRRMINEHSRHIWEWFTLPGRGWKWKMRTGGLRLADDVRKDPPSPCDAIFATSLLSLPDLLSVLPSSVFRTQRPTRLVYMHENQLVYPSRVTDARDSHFALTNYATMRAADRIIWNSRWNMASCLDGLKTLLKDDPDRPDERAFTEIESRSEVIWPPVDVSIGDGGDADSRTLRPSGSQRIRVAWPHRWEHDKGPDELCAIADRWSDELNLEWVLLGERFEDVPPGIASMLDRHQDRIVHAGFAATRAEYLTWLQSCDWVLSAATHEFFGIAVAEALMLGCLPWLPDRLSYPELLPKDARGYSPIDPPNDPGELRRAIQRHLRDAKPSVTVAKLDDAIDAAVCAQAELEAEGRGEPTLKPPSTRF